MSSKLDAGFRTERVDVSSRRLVFRRRRESIKSPADTPVAGRTHSPRAPGLISRVRAALAGTVWVAPGVDLTEPTGELWRAEES